ncbi:MAG: HAD family hydrolase [Akkermansiaceae bacterium]
METSNVTRAAVIFDLDGTLIHSLPSLAGSLNRVLEANNYPTHSEAAVRRFIGNGVRKLIERALPESISPLSSPDLMEPLVHAVSEDYHRTWQNGTYPYPGVTNCLATLQAASIPLAVVSNKPDEFCRVITDALFPSVEFSTVVGQLPGVPAKPDPTSSLKAAADMRRSPEDIWFLGDSTIDLITAKNAGMVSVAATWGYHDHPALIAEAPCHSIDSIAEFPALLGI